MSNSPEVTNSNNYFISDYVVAQNIGDI